MTFRKDGIDSIAREGRARYLGCAARDLDQKPDGGCLGAEEGLHTRATFPTDSCHFNDAAIRINRDHRNDAAIGEEDVVERTVGVQQDLTGPRFGHRIEAVVERFSDMQADLDREP
jgi:hypothetical protein